MIATLIVCYCQEITIGHCARCASWTTMGIVNGIVALSQQPVDSLIKTSTHYVIFHVLDDTEEANSKQSNRHLQEPLNETLNRLYSLPGLFQEWCKMASCHLLHYPSCLACPFHHGFLTYSWYCLVLHAHEICQSVFIFWIYPRRRWGWRFEGQ